MPSFHLARVVALAAPAALLAACLAPGSATESLACATDTDCAKGLRCLTHYWICVDASIEAPDPGDPGSLQPVPIAGDLLTTRGALPFGYVDAVYAPGFERIFLSYGAEGVVRVFDIASKKVTTLDLGHIPSRMTWDALHSRVLVALVVAGFSEPERDDTPHGFVVAIDPAALTASERVWVPRTPARVLPSVDRAVVHVASKMRDQADIVTLDLDSGDWLDGETVWDMELAFVPHTSGRRAYGAPVATWRDELVRVDLSAEGVVGTSERELPRDRSTCGDLRVSAEGSTLIARCGDVLASGPAIETDMTWVANLGASWIDLSFGTDGAFAYLLFDQFAGDEPDALRGSDGLGIVDMSLPRMTFSHTLHQPARRLFARDDDLLVVLDQLTLPPSTEILSLPLDHLGASAPTSAR
ncbi:MAG: hypothetical protein R3F39_14145 [Myxococcota bacterium]